jgi:heat shock protein HtpX
MEHRKCNAMRWSSLASTGAKRPVASGLGKRRSPTHIEPMNRADTIDLLEQRRNHALNTFHTWLLAFGSLALLAITAWAFGGTAGILYAIIFGGVSMWAVRRISPQIVLRMYKARAVSPADFPTGADLIAELSRRAGLPAVPKLFVVPSKLMNAFAVGRRDDSAIAITDALARNLTTRELAGVLAHEISHIAHGDVKVMAFADMVARFTSVMSTVGILSLVINLGSFFGGGGRQVPWLAVAVLMAAPTVGGLLQMALSRTREFDADLGAAMLTGDPDGLASALWKLERAHGRIWESIFFPAGRIPDPSVLRTHPLTERRIARLKALKTESGQAVGPSTAQPPITRASIVPKIRTAQPSGDSGSPLFLSEPSPLIELDHNAPASDRSLFQPDGPPRLHLSRGAVWW